MRRAKRSVVAVIAVLSLATSAGAQDAAVDAKRSTDLSKDRLGKSVDSNAAAAGAGGLEQAANERKANQGNAGPMSSGDDTYSDGAGKSLDQLLARALENNPDIAVAEAKVSEAAAQLNQVRLRVAQNVIRMYYARREIEQRKESYKSAYEAARQRYKAGTYSADSLEKIARQLAATEAELAASEAGLQYESGTGIYHGKVNVGQGVRIRQDFVGVAPQYGSQPPQGYGNQLAQAGAAQAGRPDAAAAQTEKTRRQLAETRIAVEAREVSLNDYVRTLSQATGLNFIISSGINREAIELSFQIQGEISAENALRIVADLHPVAFVFRDYGVLVTSHDKVPSGAQAILTRRSSGDAARRAAGFQPQAGH